MNFNFFLVALSLAQGLAALIPGPTLSIARYNHNVINTRFKIPCPMYCPRKKGHSHVLPPWIGSQKNCSTSQSPQHQLHNLGYGPRIAPMDEVTEFISWQIIQLRVHTNMSNLVWQNQ